MTGLSYREHKFAVMIFVSVEIMSVGKTSRCRNFFQIFRIFDRDGNGSIDFKEFMMATDMTCSGTPEEKLSWAFRVSDNYFTYFLATLYQYTCMEVYLIPHCSLNPVLTQGRLA